MGRKRLPEEVLKEHARVRNAKYWKKYAEKNREKLRKRRSDPEKMRQWRENNRERYNAYQREWRRKRKEQQAKKIDKEPEV